MVDDKKDEDALEQSENTDSSEEGAEGVDGAENSPPEPVGFGLKLVGYLSIVPVLGALFSFIGLALGLVAGMKGRDGSKGLLVTSMVGLLLNLALIGGGYYFVFVTKTIYYDTYIENKVRGNLDDIPQLLYAYKAKNKAYPKILSEAFDEELYFDPLSTFNAHSGTEKETFYYELTPDKEGFYLLGVGADGYPFTSDDILPDLDVPQTSSIRPGLNIHPISGKGS